MMVITFYDTQGKITGYLESEDPDQIEVNKVGNWILGQVDSDTQYIKNGQITDRPNQQTKLNGLTLVNLPSPCTVIINGTPYECDSDTAELEFDQPTNYEIRVESWPYQDWETTYENKA